MEPDYTLGLCAQLACLWEATARKPGNVHRFKDFADTSYLDFAASAAAIAPLIAVAPHYLVGETVAEGVRLTRHVAPMNTNLGILLLLAPLAKASHHPDYRSDVERVLRELTDEDAAQTYYAIRLANPGGLGEVEEGDVREDPPLPLREAMARAAYRDLIARQYANGFREVFEEGAPAIECGIARTACIEGGIIYAHLYLMSRFPDSLIGRKCGGDIARESAARAGCVLDLGWPQSEAGRREIVELDDWLREDGHRRNPGTTADMIAASLFVLLRLARLQPVRDVPWPLAEGAP